MGFNRINYCTSICDS